MVMKMVILVKVVLLLAAAGTGAPEETSGRMRKPFFYGRGFELGKDSKKGDGRDELYSPLIMNPIRALPSNSTHPDEETLKQNQNEIFTSVRDFMRERSLNQTDTERHGEETTTAEVSRLKSRQDGDRSLMVVLPFKADGGNVEELFTKSPLVKVIENDEENGQGTSPVTRETTTEWYTATTERHIATRKRWRPSPTYRSTTEAPITETTTEHGEDATKTYTNYDDVEMVTRKFGSPVDGSQIITNHNYDVDVVTVNPIYKRFTAKIKKGQTKSDEQTTTTEEFVPFSSTEKPKDVKTKLKRKGQRRKPTTEGPPKPEDISKILDILPGDVKDFILQMGLNKESKEPEGSGNNFRLERPAQPTIDPMSYAVFKPLPLEGQNENRNFVPDDMKDFLASFGLLPATGRVQKSLKTETPVNKKPVEDLSDVNLDFLPDDLKTLLQEMGLVKSDSKKEPTRIHIFNPSNHSIAHSEEDFEKLNAILSSIKTTVNKSQSLTPEKQTEVIEKIKDLNNLRYKSANLTEINNEIKKIVVNNKNSSEIKYKSPAKRATKLLEGPDPLMFTEDSLLKNDVKRQDNSTNTSSADTTASASSSSDSDGETTTTTEEAPNIEALKESFGGGETASDDADIDSSLPPKRPNGLYLLLDWNSFLEVGTEDDSRRVNLRFQPKIGDSRNFLPVSVP